MRSRSLAVVVSVCLAFVAGANAQLAESDSPSEGDNRPAAPTPLTPGTSEEAPPADNSTAATANASTISQMDASAAARSGLPYELFARHIRQVSGFCSNFFVLQTTPRHRYMSSTQFNTISM